MKRWYVVHTHVQTEEKAAYHLMRQGFEVYLPRFLKIRKHARRKDTVKKPLFPRYLFVAFDISLDRWRSVNSTIGVSYMICEGEAPAPVPELVIEDIKLREDECGHVKLSKYAKYKKGESIQVIDGAMSNQVGIFDCARDEDRVRIFLNLLGRKIGITLPSDSVEALS